MPEACTICQKDDRIEKVSAIVSSGTAYGSNARIAGYSMGSSNYSQNPTFTQSALASILAAPVCEYTYESPWGCFTVGLVLLSTAAFVYFIISLITATPEQLAHPTVGGIIVYLVIIALGVAVLITNFYQVKKRKDLAVYARARYDRARPIWDKLYYCYRDDIVFVPGKSNEYAPASEMSKLLYSS